MSKLRSRLSYATVGVTLVLVLGASGFAMASIPGHGGIIHACYQKHDGGLRVIDRSKGGFAGKCRKSEKSLSWNQKGQPGIPGAPGPPGPPGASVIVRARNSTPLVVPGGTTGTYSLNGGSWTQAATETDLFFGQVTVTMPASCGYGLVTVTVMLGAVATHSEAEFCRRIRDQHPTFPALICIRARRAHRSNGQPQRPEWLRIRARRDGRFCRPGRRRVALATRVGAEVAAAMMRRVGAALTVLAACCAPASATASAAIITTIMSEISGASSTACVSDRGR